MKIRRAFLALGFGALSLSAVVSACGGDDTTPANPIDAGNRDTSTSSSSSSSSGSSGDASQSSVTFTMAYAGTATGPLHVAIAQQLNQLPTYQHTLPAQGTWPYSYTFPDSATPGTYYASAYIDVGGNNNTGPGAEDPRNTPVQFTLSAGAPVNVQVSIKDPTLTDGGSDAPADGPKDSPADSPADTGNDAPADANDSG